VNTKIHGETLRAGNNAPAALVETARRIAENNFTPMSRVVECVAWEMASPRKTVSGRNFSVVHDMWGSDNLALRLSDDPNMYKLRRAGN
jgi:hypothetical protein